MAKTKAIIKPVPKPIMSPLGLTGREVTTRVVGARSNQSVDLPSDPHPGSNLPATGTVTDKSAVRKKEAAGKKGVPTQIVEDAVDVTSTALLTNDRNVAANNSGSAVKAKPTKVVETVTKVADPTNPDAATIPGTQAQRAAVGLASGTVTDSNHRTPRHGNHKAPKKTAVVKTPVLKTAVVKSTAAKKSK